MKYAPHNALLAPERAHHLHERYCELRSQFLHEQHMSEEAARYSLGKAHEEYMTLSAQLAAGVARCEQVLHELAMRHGVE